MMNSKAKIIDFWDVAGGISFYPGEEPRVVNTSSSEITETEL
jgi:hypothetical protein